VSEDRYYCTFVETWEAFINTIEAKLVRIIVHKMYSVMHSMQLHVLAESGMPFWVD
jgi:hypothetical protein